MLSYWIWTKARSGRSGNYIESTEIIIIKGNEQWSYQGLTHTGCIKGGGIDGQSNPGVGTITPGEYEVITYDFDNSITTRLDIDFLIKQHKAGQTTEQEVKDAIDSFINS